MQAPPAAHTPLHPAVVPFLYHVAGDTVAGPGPSPSSREQFEPRIKCPFSQTGEVPPFLPLQGPCVGLSLQSLTPSVCSHQGGGRGDQCSGPPRSRGRTVAGERRRGCLGWVQGCAPPLDCDPGRKAVPCRFLPHRISGLRDNFGHLSETLPSHCLQGA